MVEVIGWIRRHFSYPHEPKARNVLVTYHKGTEVRWRTAEEANRMIALGIVNYVTPQRGKTIKYVEVFKENDEPTLDE